MATFETAQVLECYNLWTVRVIIVICSGEGNQISFSFCAIYKSVVTTIKGAGGFWWIKYAY